MFDARTNLSAEVRAEVRRHLGPAVYDTQIPRSVRLSEAPSHGLPIALYERRVEGCRAYDAFAREFRARLPAVESAADRTTRPVREPVRSRSRLARRQVSIERACSGPALGRGLVGPDPAATTPPTPAADEIPLERDPGQSQPAPPRRRARQPRGARASIADHGVLQPVLVTETLDGYRLVAGERRVQAARLAGLERIPAIVRQLADREQLELALVENVQREDLNPIEEANAFRQLAARSSG